MCWIWGHSCVWERGSGDMLWIWEHPNVPKSNIDLFGMDFNSAEVWKAK